MVVIRRAKSEEVSKIEEVYAQARQFMAKTEPRSVEEWIPQPETYYAGHRGGAVVCVLRGR